MQEQQNPLFIQCAIHRRSHYQFLSLNVEDQSRLVCPECLIPEQDVEINPNTLIPLCIATSSPEQLIKWMHKDIDETLFKAFEFSNKNLEQEFSAQFKIIEQLQQILEDFKIILQKQLKSYKKLQDRFKKCREQFLETSKYNFFIQLVSQLQQLENMSDEQTTVQQTITAVVGEMMKNKNISICEEFEEIKRKYSKHEIDSLCKEKETNLDIMKKLFQQHDSFMKKIHDQISFTPSKIVSSFKFEALRQKIQKECQRYIKGNNLLYQGTRDGLNSGSFWNKVERKQNLLMIFRSNKFGIFGGYSPCQWSFHQDRRGVADKTLTSFLFFYKLKYYLNLDQSLGFTAICCDSKYGPQFGIDDLSVTYDFKIKFHLGKSYIIHEEDREITTKLFNREIDQIEECEIYQFIFA